VIEVNAGDMFTVDFQATPATGYQWSVAGVPAGVEFLSDSFTPEGNAAAVPATGTHTFHFLAARRGTVELRFVLKRSWEATSLDERAIQVNVTG